MHRFESALHRPCSDNPPCVHRLRDTLHRVLAQVFVFELARFEIMGARRDNNRIRRCDSLQAGGNIRRLADHGALLGSAFSDNVTDHDRSRGNPYPYRELDGFPGIGNCIDLCNCAHKLQSGVNRTLRVIFVRLRIAEVGEHTITHVAGHVPVVTFDGSLGSVLISAIYFPQLFGVELLGKLSRANQVAEHHGKLSAFRLRSGCGACSTWRLVGDRSGGGRVRRGELRDGAEDPLAWPHGQADFTQILLRKMGDIAQLDLVLGEDIGILAEPQFIEPYLQGANSHVLVISRPEDSERRLGRMSNLAVDPLLAQNL